MVLSTWPNQKSRYLLICKCHVGFHCLLLTILINGIPKNNCSYSNSESNVFQDINSTKYKNLIYSLVILEIKKQGFLSSLRHYTEILKNPLFMRKSILLPNVNVKMKTYKTADSKCTIMAKYSEKVYNLSGSDKNELQKRHLREGEIYA